MWNVNTYNNLKTKLLLIKLAWLTFVSIKIFFLYEVIFPLEVVGVGSTTQLQRAILNISFWELKPGGFVYVSEFRCIKQI